MADARQSNPTVRAIPGQSQPVVGLSARGARERIGRYELLFELARGGMGTVHVARLASEHGIRRLVALKMLPSGRFEADQLASFVAEARITSQVNHPNVVQCFDFGVEEGTPFLVMQLVEGPSLSRLLHALRGLGESLTIDVAAWIALQVAEGLDAAHELTDEAGSPLGLVHRDISPQNVLVSHTGRVFVADFGIAKLLEAEHVTRSGELKGKLGYMSPEQTRGELVDRRTDVFALGIVLYEMLTGQRPFAAASLAEAVYRINNVEVTPVHALRADVPPGLAALVRRCLARDREDRPATMKTVAGELRRVLRAEGKSVDESDLASVLARALPEERESFRERVRTATGPDASVPVPPAPPGDPVLPSATLTASALPGVVEQRRSLRWAGGLLAIGLVVVAWAALRRSEPSRDAVASAPREMSPSSQPSSSEPSSSEPSSPSSRLAPPVVPLDPSVPASSPDPAPSVVGAPRPPTLAATSPRAVSSSAPSSPPSSAPSTVAPSASSYKGVPFRDL